MGLRERIRCCEHGPHHEEVRHSDNRLAVRIHCRSHRQVRGLGADLVHPIADREQFDAKVYSGIE